MQVNIESVRLRPKRWVSRTNWWIRFASRDSRENMGQYHSWFASTDKTVIRIHHWVVPRPAVVSISLWSNTHILAFITTRCSSNELAQTRTPSIQNPTTNATSTSVWLNKFSKSRVVLSVSEDWCTFIDILLSLSPCRLRSCEAASEMLRAYRNKMDDEKQWANQMTIKVNTIKEVKSSRDAEREYQQALVSATCLVLRSFAEIPDHIRILDLILTAGQHAGHVVSVYPLSIRPDNFNLSREPTLLIRAWTTSSRQPKQSHRS